MTVEAIRLGARACGALGVDEVQAVAGKGLEGDRHFHEEGAAARPGTDAGRGRRRRSRRAGGGRTRRQLTVRGVALNDLVGKRFHVGEVECYGVALCEPCSHLESLTRPGIIEGSSTARASTRTSSAGGVIRVGDSVTAC